MYFAIEGVVPHAVHDPLRCVVAVMAVREPVIGAVEEHDQGRELRAMPFPHRGGVLLDHFLGKLGAHLRAAVGADLLQLQRFQRRCGRLGLWPFGIVDRLRHVPLRGAGLHCPGFPDCLRRR